MSVRAAHPGAALRVYTFAEARGGYRAGRMVRLMGRPLMRPLDSRN